MTNRRTSGRIPAPCLASLFLAAGAGVVLSGCATPAADGRPDAVVADPTAQPRAEARQLVLDAIDRMETAPGEAADMLRRAIELDPYQGPGWNNVGVLALRRGDLFEAARAFETAGRLMPGNPDPRLNLGLVLERAGRIDDAIASYRTALEVQPEHLPSMQALARAMRRWDRDAADLPSLLDRIAVRAESERWREWAAQQRTLLRGAHP